MVDMGARVTQDKDTVCVMWPLAPSQLAKVDERKQEAVACTPPQHTSPQQRTIRPEMGQKSSAHVKRYAKTLHGVHMVFFVQRVTIIQIRS